MMNSKAHWRDSARQARFFGLDGRAAFLLLFFVLHIRLWTFIVALIGIVFLAILERMGFSVNVFLCYLRNVLAGSRKIAIVWWK